MNWKQSKSLEKRDERNSETALGTTANPGVNEHEIYSLRPALPVTYTSIMAKTYSTMLALGTQAPDFSITDLVSGRVYTLDTFHDRKALLVMFICRHCPYVVHVQDELARLGRDYLNKNIAIVAISSNDAAAYPEDAPERLKEMAMELGFTFPYGYDATQEMAKRYTAACTPDFFLFDSSRRLVYRGQLDDSRPSNGKPVTGKDLRTAIDAVLSDRPVPTEQKPSMGCNIKWKPGNAPSYYTGL